MLFMGKSIMLMAMASMANCLKLLEGKTNEMENCHWNSGKVRYMSPKMLSSRFLALRHRFWMHPKYSQLWQLEIVIDKSQLTSCFCSTITSRTPSRFTMNFLPAPTARRLEPISWKRDVLMLDVAMEEQLRTSRRLWKFPINEAVVNEYMNQ